jgi:DMSO/TMAO reductase YedYZ molybdopterin-dependent catalytic subunit
MNRRQILKSSVGLLALTEGTLSVSGLLRAAQFTLPSGAVGEQALEALSGKVPLIKKTYRPPNYETPVSFFNEPYTPNDAFFVRYHLADIPEVDASTWKLKIGGPGAERGMELTFDELKNNYQKTELTAVCQCSGNRRGFSDPHVPGVEWGNGAIGNAKWGGVRLKDVLDKSGVKKETIEVSLNGADGAVFDKTPDFIKSIPLWKAIDENTLIAYEMNGEPLPHWNGFPARVIVPGWTATYWMKHIVDIQLLTEPLKNFWVNTAYRIPKSMFPVVQRFVSQEPVDSPTTPITEIVVNSLVTSHEDGAEVKAGQPLELRGIAWDGGYGIADVAVSTDGGTNWGSTMLGTDLGKYSWRQWSFTFTPAQAGEASVMVRARNAAGATQVDKLLFNGAGYHNNVAQKLTLKVV